MCMWVYMWLSNEISKLNQIRAYGQVMYRRTNLYPSDLNHTIIFMHFRFKFATIVIFFVFFPPIFLVNTHEG